MLFLARIFAVLLGLAVLAVFAWPLIGHRSVPELPAATESPFAIISLAPNTVAVPAPKDKGNDSLAETNPAPSAPPAAQSSAPASQPMTMGEEKHIRLAREQAEIDRLAALEKQHATQPSAPTKLYRRIKVRDSGTIEASSADHATIVIRLDGIEARGAQAECAAGGGDTWPCGAQARLALLKFIRYRAVTCALPSGGEQPEFAARCSVAGADLSSWVVRQGWAEPRQPSETSLADAWQAAKTDKVGIWREEGNQNAEAGRE